MGRNRKATNAGGWRKKLRPVFFELAELNAQFERRWKQIQDDARKEFDATGANPSPEVCDAIVFRFKQKTSDLEAWFEQKLIQINARHKPIPYNPAAYAYFTLDQPMSDSEGIRQYLHFHRHGESLHVSEEKDGAGDLEAFDKIARTERDVRMIVFGKGPIAPFQEDMVQRQLLQLVICYECEKLTAAELAECFDQYCACEKQTHDQDSLRKMRDRFQAELDSAIGSSSQT